MTEGYEEDLDMYEEAAATVHHTLDNDSLLRPIKDLNYPEDPASIDADAKVSEALEKMVERKLGALLVMKGDELVGIFAERDALMKGLFQGGQADRPVRDFMTPDPVCLSRHDTIALALNQMVLRGFRHIPIVNLILGRQGNATMRSNLFVLLNAHVTIVHEEEDKLFGGGQI